MAARSVTVKLKNTTRVELELEDMQMEHGSFVNGMYPQARIPARYSGFWKSEETGIATGCTGSVKYMLGDDGIVYIWWHNPYIGNNEYKFSAPKGYEISMEEGSGNDATPVFTLKKVASAMSRADILADTPKSLPPEPINENE